jgi:hypothetical protein
LHGRVSQTRVAYPLPVFGFGPFRQEPRPDRRIDSTSGQSCHPSHNKPGRLGNRVVPTAGGLWPCSKFQAVATRAEQYRVQAKECAERETLRTYENMERHCSLWPSRPRKTMAVRDRASAELKQARAMARALNARVETARNWLSCLPFMTGGLNRSGPRVTSVRSVARPAEMVRSRRRGSSPKPGLKFDITNAWLCCRRKNRSTKLRSRPPPHA